MKTFESQFCELLAKENILFDEERRKSFFEFLEGRAFEKKDFDFWRHSGLKKLELFSLSEKNLPPCHNIKKDHFSLVFYHGIFQRNLSSLPSQGVTIYPLSPQEQKLLMRQNKNKLTLFNDSFFEPGVNLEIDKNFSNSQPIFIHHINSSSQNFSRICFKNKITLKRGAQATFVEVFENSCSFMNRSCSIFLEEMATLNALQIQKSKEDTFHTDLNFVELSEKSHFEIFLLSLGSFFARHEFNIKIKGSFAKALVKGFYLGRRTQTKDHQVSVVHLAPESLSSQIFKGLLCDQSRGVFRSLSHIVKEAQKTKSFQLNKNLVFGNRTKVDSQPVLEVYADDVEAQHGATVGGLDSQDMFYLMSRGLKYEKAEELLLKAFVNELVVLVKDRRLQNLIIDECKGLLNKETL